MTGPTCPACGACGGDGLTGIEVLGEYDGVLIWQCGECGHRWPRFAASDPLHARAAAVLARWALT